MEDQVTRCVKETPQTIAEDRHENSVSRIADDSQSELLRTQDFNLKTLERASGCVWQRVGILDYTPNFYRKASVSSESKKPRSNSQQPTLVVQSSRQIISTGKPSLYNSGGDMWENRIYSCLVISPAGRVISDFRMVNELLAAIRDAIKAHRSLYKTGNMLHCDISSNNIIITKPDTADGFNGMLIDLID
ncbi:hypothetical protein F5Y09DRAFT_350767 [Xylaria sp. FL1042]|nr:hypothetical protein F5Y09DRAFT_350767 [Xylaria sp. FL1042]